MQDLNRIQALLRAYDLDIAVQEINLKAMPGERGISRRTLYRIRAGETNINLNTLMKLREWAKGRRLPSEVANG